MDHHALARLANTDDAVARQRMAAGAQPVADPGGKPLDRNRFVLRRRFRQHHLLAPFGIFLDFGIDRQKHVGAAQRARADVGEYVFGLGKPQTLGDVVHRLVGQIEAFVGKYLLQDLAAEFDVLAALGLTQVAFDLGARPAGDHKLLPQRRRRLLLVGDDLDLIAVAKRGVERHMDAVDLGPHRAMAEVGVDVIGEIDRCGAARQRDQVALGGEAEYLILIEVEAGMLEELLGGIAAFEQIDHLAQPLVGLDVADVAFDGRSVVAIAPVCRHPALGDLVHLLGANLHLQALMLRSDQGGVQRTVSVGLGYGNEILEPRRHGRPSQMQDAEGAVTFLRRRHDHPKAENVGQLLEADLLFLQLAPDRKRPFRSAVHPGFQTVLRQLALELVGDAGDQLGVGGIEPLQPGDDRIARLRLQFAEREVFQLFAHMLHTDAPGQRCVEFEGFLGDAAAAFRFLDEPEGTHVVGAVGQFHQQHPNVVRHRQHQFAEIFRLFGAL